jgi:hypothetical protein
VAVNVLLKLKGDASEATAAVADAETALTGLGTGVDWTSVGSKLAKSAGSMVKSGLIGAALAVGDWLAEGLSDKLKTPEGAEAQGAIDELTGELDKIRDKVLQPIIDLIPTVVDLLLPLIAHVSNLVDVALPPLKLALELAVGALELLSQSITAILDVIDDVITALSTAITDAQTFLQNVQTAIQDAIDGVGEFFGKIKTAIDGLLQPIKDAVQPILDLINGIFGKADDVPHSGVGGDWGQTPTPGGLARGGMMRGPSVVNVYTGADPRAVVRALRRYTGDNGDPGGLVRAFRGA